METCIEKFVKKSSRWIRCRASLFLFMILSVCNFTIMAQGDSSATATTNDSAASSAGPSLSNMKKTGSAMTEEMKRMKEKQARDEMLSYVYMTLGFGLVIAVAWFSTVKAKQIRERKEEEKRKFLEAKMANQSKTAHRTVHRKGHRR